MKIAFVGEAVSGFGGMETVIKGVINAFQNKEQPDDCSMFFFCRNDKMDKQWLENIDVNYSFSNQRISFFRKLKHVSAFSKWIKGYRPDVVICIDVISCLLVNQARKKAGVNFKIFSWPHFSLDHKKHAEYIVYADRHLAISSGIKKQMQMRGVSASDITLVYNPVSRKPDIIHAPENGEVTTFLYVGRMKFEGQKRIKDLLDGLARADGQWKLHVIGDGSDFSKCKEYGKQLNIDANIIWHGWQADPWGLVKNKIKSVNALLLTSSFEGFPMTLLEAQSYGIPCISSNCVTGPEDIIQNGINGYLYEPSDLNEFIGLLDKTISGDIIINRKNIPSTISDFYDEAYFDRINSAILY
ncbi:MULTISPECIES: lipopolysaccharide 1,6-galactosyltransferase [unclassified Cedecea]|uniref:lipopolysaccharide 1,6-galactosyltransferase n=1 Tax=unclassified Cedecea TaxID=2649846 RepID=UPI003019B9E4